MNRENKENKVGGFDDDLFRFMECVTVEVDATGKIVRINPFAEKHLGWRNDEMAGKSFVGALATEKTETGEDQTAVCDAFLKHPGKSGRFEVEMRASDGSTRKIAMAANACFDACGNLEKTVCVGVDRQIPTMREEEVRCRYDLVESFFEASRACTFEVNSEKKIFYVSPGAAEILGYLPEEIIGREMGAVFGPETESVIAGGGEETGETGRAGIRLKNKIRNKNGKMVWCEVDETISYRENTGLEGLAGVSRNIDEQTQAELALAEREKEFRFCLDHAQVMLIVTREDGIIKNINRAGANMFGREPEEMIGRGFTEFLPDFEKERVFHVFKKDFKAAVAKKDSRTVGMGGLINKIKTPEGLRDVLFFKTGVKVFSNKEFQGILNTAVDITETIRAREELKRHRNHLEQLVTERTAELHGLQEEMLRRERLTALGKMANVISEEIRTPLSTISASFFVINERLKNEDIGVTRTLERANRAIERCYGIVDEFKAFTQTDALNKKETDVDSWLKRILDEIAEEKGVSVNQDLGAAIRMDIDRERIQRAVLNVLENAWQAGDNERITVKSKMAFNRLEIEIADAGMGIGRQDMERVFEPLFSTKSFGLGLGLPICRQIMEQHGGGISIESEENKGTKVLLWLSVDDMAARKTGGTGEKVQYSCGG
jgi:PAS domain S-box-containing protein